MKRSQLKLIRREMARTNRQRPEVLTPLPREMWPEHGDPNVFAVFVSRRYLAQLFEEEDGVVRVSVCRTELNEAGTGWRDNLSWDELMEVKRQVGLGENYAVEVLPPDKDIVNVANMRHFWVLPERVVGWVKHG